MSELEFTGTLTVIECGGCGWSYGIPERFHTEAKERGSRWRCPNRGCSWESVGYRESEVKRLQRELESARQWSTRNREWAEREQRRAIALKGVVTRTKRRIAHGICPCCKRTFANLANHMKGQHPSYGNGDEAAP
jgi:hypothetical protein